MIGIYKITNIINNKCYIGKSLNIEDRLRRHKSALLKNTHKNKYLQNEYNKYSVNNFTFEIIEFDIDKNHLNDREIYWINYCQSFNRKYGYNMTIGGDGGYTIGNKTDKEKIYIIEKQKKSRSLKYQLSNKQISTILKLKNEGYSIRYIETVINDNNSTDNFISVKIISKFLKNNNLPTLNPKKYIFAEEERKLIINLYNQKEQIKEISKITNISGKSITRLLKEVGIYEKR